MSEPTQYDVLILGAGLAGLSLARQLLINSTDKRILLIDRREVPPERQKVGEATVQLSGYYFSRVLGLEEHLLRHHYIKYNLRFYWGRNEATRYEDCDQSFLRHISNIATYQLDRNALEDELLRLVSGDPRCTFLAPATGLDVTLSEDGGPHRFRFQTADGEVTGETQWVVDASGRNRFLAKKLDLMEKSPIRHGTSFFWVDGLVDIEKLTDLDHNQIRTRPDRAVQGHFPALLATNHFCGEGFWFWVIPLHGITSLGLVYDRERVPRDLIANPEKLIPWICERYPLFARDLPNREVVCWSGYVDFAHDCKQILSDQRWALCGEAGRFTDPLYSPGGDLITMYNTLITDAILGDPAQLTGKMRTYNLLARAIYDAYVPSYAVSYDTLGDQEAFTLRYIWELTVYYGYYVFPYINDLFTDPTFGPGFLRRFGRLGPINRGLHEFLNAFYHWKKANPAAMAHHPILFDFMESGHLKASEGTFYKVGLNSEQGRQVLDEQLANLEELARWIASHVAYQVTGDPRAREHEYVAGIDVSRLSFDPEAMRARLADCPQHGAPYAWRLPVPCMQRFERLPLPVEAPVAVEPELVGSLG